SSIPTGLPPLGLWQPAWRLVEPDGAKLPAMPHTLVVRHARDFGLARALAAETGRIAFLGRGWRRAGERYRAIDLAREADYAALLEDIPAPFDVYFLGGLARAPFDPADMAAFDRAQDTGPLALLSLVRALHASGRLGQVGRLVVVTSGVYSADGEGAGTNPAAGGLAGLCRVLHSEYPDLPLSCVDLDEAELAADPAAIARRLAEAPGLPAVELALRAGRWRRRVVEPLANLDTVTTDGLPVRPGGVYLIAGGAGGLGLIFSRHLAERGGTRLVWLGRRAADAVVERSIREVQAAGGEVLYLRADLRDPASVTAAVGEAVARFGSIHGFIHSALASQDARLPDQERGPFRAALEVKGRGTLALCEALRGQPLDFALFFSSANAFMGGPGTADYSTSCALKDALAAYYAAHLGVPAKIVDWGFWGGVGRGASPHYRGLYEARGILPIEPAEGVAACAALLSGGGRQLVVGRVDASHWEFQGLQAMPAPLPTDYAEAVQAARIEAPGAALNGLGQGLDALDGYGARRLWVELGGTDGWPEVADDAELRARFGVADNQARWFAAALAILAESGFLRREGVVWRVTATGETDAAGLRMARDELAQRHPVLHPHLALLDHCATHWRAVLRGERPGVDAMFPDGSPALLEPLYRGNPWADFLNRRAAMAVRAYLRARRDVGSLRVLEIGAGTGGTSLPVLEALAEAGLGNLEYLFTDVTQHFTGQAARVFGPRFPFLRCRALDIERPPEDQGYAAASCDVVIAANVLHATRDLAATLRRVRGLLKPGGLLVLNELTRVQAFMALSFGLLEGWWLADDRGRRLAHAPLVGAAGWRRLLNGVGFPAVTALDGPGADPLRGTPQSIILALAGGPALAAASAPVPSLVSEAAPVEPASPAAARIPAEVSLPTFLLGEISAVLAGLLDLAGRTPEPGRPFVEFGVDSLLAVEVIRALNARLGISLRKTDLFNHPTPGELAGHIAANFSAPCPAGEGLKAHRSNQNTHPRAIANTDIAVIGMAGRFPDADDLDELWRNLAAGHDAVREVPKERWDVAPLFDPNPGRPDRIYSRWGGFMRDVASFDPLFFNLTPREAETMDPQQRLFLMEAWKALENAGYSRRRLEGRRCGVFVGVTQGDYLNLLRAAGRFTDSHGSIGNSCAILPARVAYFLNLKGPCFALDTGCSSALVAVHTACQSILSGESEMALAGGVSAINTPDWHLFFCRSGMTSPTGRCHTFDDSADGFVPAEGVGVVLLKRLDRALADGDVIHGVIKAMGINQDGASNGITAPSATAQTALLREVHQRAGIAPDSLDYIETHGTGTKLG
ncbi:SDR family NAD(P)-dependent oxidoreductase, partial [Methylomagnum sp.]